MVRLDGLPALLERNVRCCARSDIQLTNQLGNRRESINIPHVVAITAKASH
jgi:hypothetical protein